MRILALLAATLTLWGLSGSSDAQTLIERGRALAKANCSRCHAIGPRGASPNPKSPPFRTLSKRYPLRYLEEALGEGIVVGHEGEEMPAFRLSPAQIRALLAYLASVQKKK